MLFILWNVFAYIVLVNDWWGVSFSSITEYYEDEPKSLFYTIYYFTIMLQMFALFPFLSFPFLSFPFIIINIIIDTIKIKK
jgi:hypothetical protein